MLDYFIAHQQIVIAWMLGGFCGTMLSIATDNNILSLYEAHGERKLTVRSAFVQVIR